MRKKVLLSPTFVIIAWSLLFHVSVHADLSKTATNLMRNTVNIYH
jgi:hypothetical protein